MPSILSVDRRLDRLESYFLDRYRDIACRVRIYETGALGPLYGGRWDMQERRYLDPWEVEYHKAAARNDDEREAAELTISELVLSLKQAAVVQDLTTPMLMLNGSRRSGKTRAGAGKSKVHACAHPGVRGQIIAPTFPKMEIFWGYLKQWIPVDWIEDSSDSTFFMRLWNDVEIKGLSAHKPDSVIGEGCGWLDFDEFQSINDRTFGLALPALSDAKAGMMQLWGQGTPRMGPYFARYRKFCEMAKKTDAAGRPRARVHRFTYLENPFIDSGKGSIFDLARGVMDERTFRQEMNAEFIAEEGLVFYRYSASKNAMIWDPEQVVDISEQYLKNRLHVDGLQYVIGVDYGTNKNHAVIFKVIRHEGQICLLAIGEVLLQRDGDITRLIADLIDHGYYPAAVFDDASGPRSKGGLSAGYRFATAAAHSLEGATTKTGEQIFHVLHYAANPHVADRIDSMNALISNADGQRRLFVDPEKCPGFALALENLELKDGKPAKKTVIDDYTIRDIADAGTYPPAYLFPAQVDFEALERLAA